MRNGRSLSFEHTCASSSRRLPSLIWPPPPPNVHHSRHRHRESQQPTRSWTYAHRARARTQAPTGAVPDAQWLRRSPGWCRLPATDRRARRLPPTRPVPRSNLTTSWRTSIRHAAQRHHSATRTCHRPHELAQSASGAGCRRGCKAYAANLKIQLLAKKCICRSLKHPPPTKWEPQTLKLSPGPGPDCDN